MKPSRNPWFDFTPGCPHCGAACDFDSLVSGPQTCPTCRRGYEAVRFSPLPPRHTQATALVAAGPNGANPCAYHPANAAEVPCSRCGAFLCALCRLSVENRELCPECFDRLRATKELGLASTRTADYRGLAWAFGCAGVGSFLFFGLCFGPAGLVAAWLALRQRQAWGDQGPGRISLAVAALLALGVTLGGGAWLAFLIADWGAS